MNNEKKSFRSFSDFYPIYLGEHSNQTCRRQHFAGTSIADAIAPVAAVTEHFRYARHFSLLTGFAVFSGVVSKLLVPKDLSLTFACYGALHALALVLSLNARQSAGRSCLFVVAAAALSAMTFHVGMLGTHLLTGLVQNAEPYAALGVAAVTGAVIYGISIRICGLYKLTAGALAAISIGCLSASLLALFTLSRFHVLGSWWLAVFWWYAFSGGLWFCDRRQDATESTH